MNYVVLFEDDETFSAMRDKYMADHLAFLESNRNRVQSAGPLKVESSGAAAGGLWLVDAESEQQVRKLVEDDPFWPTGLRKSVKVLAWTRVFADGKRQQG